MSFGILGSIVSGAGQLPIPIGIVPLAILCGMGIYLWLDHLRTLARKGAVVTPLDPAATEATSALHSGVVSVRPPAYSKGFGLRLGIAFVVILIPIALFAKYFFFGYDLGVGSMGRVLFWPHPWPGWTQVPTVDHLAADFTFMIFFAFILAYLVASGIVWARGRFTMTQRISAGVVTLSYVFAAMISDAFLFTVPSTFLESVSIILRAFLGGIFFSLLLFSTLMKPPPLHMPHQPQRAPVAFLTFLFSLVSSLLLSLGALYLMWDRLGIGRGTLIEVQFRAIILLPLLTYTVWALEGRAIYALDLRRHPPAPLSSYHPDVSILIPAYNEQAGIHLCIRAADAAARFYPGRTEILVGNDGSEDRTSEIAHAEMRRLRYARGRCIDLPHGGKASALNGALKEATGEIVIRVDADTFIHPGRGFASMIGHLADQRVGGVQGMILPYQRTGWIRKMRMLEIVWRHMFLFRSLMGTRTIQVVAGGFSGFRRTDLLRLGGWVPWNGEDCEITLRFQRAGYILRYEPTSRAFEDVPATYRALYKQRVRWNRGGFFSHARHYDALISGAPEWGGLAMLYWFVLYARGGLRYLGFVYTFLVAVFFHLLTLETAFLVLGLIMLPKSIAMTYYLAKERYWSYIPWIVTWPVTSAIKQYFSVEAWGTIFPGAFPEFSE